MEDKTALLKIEEVLIDEGFVSSQEMTEARDSRKRPILSSLKNNWVLSCWSKIK